MTGTTGTTGMTGMTISGIFFALINCKTDCPINPIEDEKLCQIFTSDIGHSSHYFILFMR
jgi:hypothetical protein